MSRYNYNLRPQDKDERDFRLSAVLSPVPAVKLPKSVDLRSLMDPIYDQGQIGSCTANAGIAAREMILGSSKQNLSRLYLYYKERELEGTINQDGGAQMRTICKAFNQFGCCEESFMPYDAGRFALAPPPQAEENAAKYKISAYHAVMSINEIKQCLALRQRPVLIGMEVFQSFETLTAKNAVVQLPKAGEQSLGGHAVCVVGYKEPLIGKPYLIVRNSWGTTWGDQGYFYMPYEYVTKGYAFDFWTIDQ